jgi:hypothetical protein
VSTRRRFLESFQPSHGSLQGREFPVRGGRAPVNATTQQQSSAAAKTSGEPAKAGASQGGQQRIKGFDYRAWDKLDVVRAKRMCVPLLSRWQICGSSAEH